jgi:hypothetical protein
VILKAERKKCLLTYKGKNSIITSDLIAETLNARKAWNDIFQALRVNNCQPRILYQEMFSFKINVKIKTFQDKQKLKECMISKAELQKICKGILHTK